MAELYNTKIENVVTWINLGIDIDLYELKRRFYESTSKNRRGYEDSLDKREKFSGLIYRSENPRFSMLIFSSGKMVCTKTKSEDEAIDAAKHMVERIRELDIHIPDEPKVKIVNIIATGDLGLSDGVDLEDAYDIFSNLHFLYPNEVDMPFYDPEEFPGLICKIVDPKLTFNLFKSSKFVCVGAKTKDDIYRGIDKFSKLLKGI